MSNIIEFPGLHRGQRESDPENGYFIIDKRSPNIVRELDELWNEFYIGKSLTDVFSDDDGIIHFTTEWVDYKNDDLHVLRGFLVFMIDFLNNRRELISDFLNEYDKHVSETGHKRLLGRQK